MTDAAVADSGPAPEAPVVEGAVINENAPAFNAPLGSQIPPDAVAKPEAPAKPASLDDSIDRAIAKSAEKQAKAAEPAKDVKPEPVKEAKPEAKPRDEGGKFAKQQNSSSSDDRKGVGSDGGDVRPSEGQDHREPPSRLLPHSREEWGKISEFTQQDIHRGFRNLENGLNEHKEARTKAEKEVAQYRDVVEPLKPYLQLAQKHNTTIDKALDQYIRLEQTLRSPNMAEKQAALDDVFHVAGINPREWAAQLLNQTPDQAATQQDTTIRELRQEIAGLKQQIGGVTQTIEQQREEAVLSDVTKFASAEGHERFEELAEDIAFFMKSGRAKDLSEAYELAERLNPASAAQASVSPPVIPATPTPVVAHTDKGSKSINGAPSSSLTSPAAKKRVTRSLDDALDRAFGAVG